MYTAGKRARKSKVGPVLLIVFLIAVVFAYNAYRQFSDETETIIQNSSGETRQTEAPADKKTRFEEATFAFELPADWKKVTGQSGAYPKFSYQSSLKNADNRYLDVYVDKLPLDLAVNKAVAVRSTGAKLTNGVASDNCTTFTTAQGNGQSTLTVRAKWDGVEFICDLGSVTRNVIGTSSQESVNQVALTGPTTGPHKYFITYTDNNYNPDYSIFYKMLGSFTAK